MDNNNIPLYTNFGNKVWKITSLCFYVYTEILVTEFKPIHLKSNLRMFKIYKFAKTFSIKTLLKLKYTWLHEFTMGFNIRNLNNVIIAFFSFVKFCLKILWKMRNKHLCYMTFYLQNHAMIHKLIQFLFQTYHLSIQNINEWMFIWNTVWIIALLTAISTKHTKTTRYFETRYLLSQ